MSSSENRFSAVEPSEALLIRRATPADCAAITALEAACFPPAEAAPYESFTARLAAFPDRFFLLILDGKPVSMVNGSLTNEADLRDEMFHDAALHDPEGGWQMIFGVATHPDYRRRGYAGALLRHAIRICREEGREGLVLTCKQAKLDYYARFGFVNEGLSSSEHGGDVWYQMRIRF
jgi:ribosomal protein S18 acetylase RimI-like enzyme